MSTKEKSSQLQTPGPEKFDIERLKKITEDFSDNRIIGRGGFGIVYKGTHKRKFIAVKKLFIKPETAQIDDEKFENEVINVMRISHPNIVRLVGYCSTIEKEATRYQGKPVFAENHYRLICFEYLEGSLDKYLKDKCHVDWNERYNIIKGISRGLHDLHGKHILHLDLKPANVLLDEGMVPKIADFGLSRLWQPDEGQIHTKNIKGTPGYMAPECIDDRVLSYKTDIYSLGVIIMEIISGEKNPTNEQLEKAVLAARNEGMSEQIKKCIQLARDCREKEPEKRPDTKKIIEDLGITEDTNPHPDITEEHSVSINNDSGEVNPLVVDGRTGLLQRSTMTDTRSSPLQIMESSTTAVTVRTQSRGMMVCGIPIPIVIGSVLGGVVLYCVLCSWLLFDVVPSYEMSRTVSITVEEAPFTRFALVTASSSSPVLTYNLSVMMGIYNPSLYVPMVTKPLEAAFFFGGQRFHVVRFGENGQHLATTLVSLGRLSGNLTLDTAGVAEYRKEASTATGSLFEVEMVVVGQVMYSGTFTICNVQATCPFKLRHAPPDGTTELELFQKVKCPLHRNCTSYQ